MTAPAIRERFAVDRLSARSFDADGRLFVEGCNISKATVNPYYGREIPNSEALGLDANTIYNLYRDPAELAAAAPTFANLQLLLTHVGVNADDPKLDLTAGTVGSDVSFVAPYLQASLKVWTAEAIALIESGAQAQLSCSYRYRADMTPGTSPEGVAFDGTMRDIIGNHVALVEEGRAGPDVLVADHQIEAPPMTTPRTPKYPKFLAALKAMFPAAKDEQLLACDAAMEEEVMDAKPDEEAMDGKPESCSAEDWADMDDEEKKAAKDAAFEAAEKKKADDAAAAVSPGPKEGERGAALDEAEKDKAMDAKIKAVRADTIKAVNALHQARADVAPIVGVVAMDSAEAVYRFALDKAGVDVAGVDPSAYGALVKAELRTRAKTATPAPRLASDGVSSLDAMIPGLGRIKQG